MSNSKFLFGSLSVALVSATVAFSGSAANAQIATDTDTISFSGTVPLECALINDGLSNTGSSATYTSTTVNVGTDANASGGDTNRTGTLSATDTSTFDCNSDTVLLNVTLDTLSKPAPTVATALASTHTVDVSTNGTSATGSPFADPVNSFVTNVTSDNDANGDVEVEVTSSFSTAGEELFAGAYSADFTVSVTAQ